MRRLPPSLASIALLFCLTSTSYGQTSFTARLTGAQETPSVATPAIGTGSFVFSSIGLQFYITVEGLSGPIVAAHIYDGQPGMAGFIVRTITPEFGGTNTAAGLWAFGDPQPLTSALVGDLMAGNLYVSIITPPFGPGEIRGQIQLSSGVHFTANLQGPQVNPPVGVAGTGAGSFTLNEEGLQYRITLNGLTGVIGAAHIHTGAIGVNGPGTFTITPSFVGNTASGFIPAPVITAVDRKNLIAGNMYVDIHTAAFPTGEIRGQINLAGGFGFSIKMDGAQETPPNGVTALGNASATLTPLGLLLNLTGTGLSGGITFAHLHNAPAGVPGPIVRDIFPDFVSPTTAQVLWRADDPMPMTPALVAELLNNKIYVNLHTGAFPGGEIRGQLILNTPAPAPEATYTATLTGAQEEPPTPIPGLGTGTFQLTPGGLTFNVTVDGLTGPITAATFHNAAIGVVGPVARPIAGAEFIGPNSIAGIWTPGDPFPFTAAMMTALFKGEIYLNFHTGAFPGGEIRGQLVPASGAEFEARLTAAQETPPNPTLGLATGSFTLTPHGLAFNITSDGLTGAITAAHFHLGARGVLGAVVRPIVGAEFVTANTLAGVWKPTDASALTPALVTELLKGNIYVNLHTAAFPGGEIRGQLTLSGSDPCAARMVGYLVVPPSGSLGHATSAMTLTDEGHVFRFTANDMTGAPTAAHIHDAGPGVNGPAVRPVYAGETLGSQTADAVWKTSDADPLTTALLGDMSNGKLYIDVHTGGFPAGEIRGQIGCPQSTVSVTEPPNETASLLQLRAEPNPLSEQTTVMFYLPWRSDVSLAVYDVTGAHVAQLARGQREAGWHNVPFDARGLSSGIYLFRLDAAHMNLSRKMLVVR